MSIIQFLIIYFVIGLAIIYWTWFICDDPLVVTEREKILIDMERIHWTQTVIAVFIAAWLIIPVYIMRSFEE